MKHGFVWLASYPKSGNTWLRLLLQSSLGGGAEAAINRMTIGEQPAIDRAAFDEHIGVPASDLTEQEQLAWRPAALRCRAARLEGPFYAKTHMAQKLLPSGDWLHPPDVSLGAIVIVRDPRDIASSLARHLAADLDAVISLMADVNCVRARSSRRLHEVLADPWSSWSNHVASWLDAPAIPTTVIRYEDLRADPVAVLTHLMIWLGQSVTAEAIQGAVKETHIDVLQAQETAEGFREWNGRGRFFGEARPGAWRERLTSAQARRIEDGHGAIMRRLGYLE